MLGFVAYKDISSKGSALVKRVLCSTGLLCTSRRGTLRLSSGMKDENNTVSCSLLLSNLVTRHRRKVAVSITCHCFAASGEDFVITSAPKRRRCAEGVTINTSFTSLTIVLISTSRKMLMRAEHRTEVYTLVKVHCFMFTMGGVSLVRCSRGHFHSVRDRVTTLVRRLGLTGMAVVPMSTARNSGIAAGSSGVP